MNQQQAEKIAAKQSKTQGAQYVVYVFDQGREVYDSAQATRCPASRRAPGCMT